MSLLSWNFPPGTWKTLSGLSASASTAPIPRGTLYVQAGLRAGVMFTAAAVPMWAGGSPVGGFPSGGTGGGPDSQPPGPARCAEWPGSHLPESGPEATDVSTGACPLEPASPRQARGNSPSPLHPRQALESSPSHLSLRQARGNSPSHLHPRQARGNSPSHLQSAPSSS